MFNLLVLDHFLDPEARAALLRELESASGAEAEVYGASASGAVDARTRSAKKLVVAPATREMVRTAFGNVQQKLEQHFAIPLTSFEAPQFLRYQTGDFFVAHQDGNTPVIHDDARHRRVSVVVFLSDESAYSGGSLVLHGRYPDFDKRHPVPSAPGSLIAFPSETTHEVTPLTDGHRYTIVTWFR